MKIAIDRVAGARHIIKLHKSAATTVTGIVKNSRKVVHTSMKVEVIIEVTARGYIMSIFA